MNLDDLNLIQQIDQHNMLAEIDHLPEQLEKAWQLGQTLELPPMEKISRLLIAGMGGSAIGADLVSAYVAQTCPIPVTVHRDYGLPAWARGPETLVIASSHSGNTEETLDSFSAALAARCQTIAICTGGELAERARAAGVPVWRFEHAGQPRAAVGYSFGLLLAILSRLGLIASPGQLTAEIASAVEAMKQQQTRLQAGVATVHNPAKRQAGQLMGRWVNVYGSGVLAPVARRWKGQINELAKAGAGFEVLPEADHNALAGLENPDLLLQTITLFLRCASDHPRNRLRSDLTRQAFLQQGLNTDVYEATGNSPLAQMWTAIHFGDYTAFYLAMAYGVDPTPVNILQDFKAAMKAAR